MFLRPKNLERRAGRNDLHFISVWTEEKSPPFAEYKIAKGRPPKIVLLLEGTGSQGTPSAGVRVAVK